MMIKLSDTIPAIMVISILLVSSTSAQQWQPVPQGQPIPGPAPVPLGQPIPGQPIPIQELNPLGQPIPLNRSFPLNQPLHFGRPIASNPPNSNWQPLPPPGWQPAPQIYNTMPAVGARSGTVIIQDGLPQDVMPAFPYIPSQGKRFRFAPVDPAPQLPGISRPNDLRTTGNLRSTKNKELPRQPASDNFEKRLRTSGDIPSIDRSKAGNIKMDLTNDEVAIKAVIMSKAMTIFLRSGINIQDITYSDGRKKLTFEINQDGWKTEFSFLNIKKESGEFDLSWEGDGMTPEKMSSLAAHLLREINGR